MGVSSSTPIIFLLATQNRLLIFKCFLQLLVTTVKILVAVLCFNYKAQIWFKGNTQLIILLSGLLSLFFPTGWDTI
jgi:hypothetical protein